MKNHHHHRKHRINLNSAYEHVQAENQLGHYGDTVVIAEGAKISDCRAHIAESGNRGIESIGIIQSEKCVESG